MNKIQQEVDWTILIYANGNNELEPEMWQAFLDVEKVGSNSNVHVVIQIGRADYKLVKLIRPNIILKNNNSWTGVRRYFVNKSNSSLVGNLKTINMADPKQLHHFIKWGMLSYPAKKFMLILGGHSYDCVGMMMDYSRKAPYIMGIPEMVRGINMAANEVGKNIDILLLDTCSANSLELIYEFSKDENHVVQSIITYIVNGPIEGLPYDKIINSIQTNSKIEDITVTIKDIIENLSYDLIAFEVNHQKLQKIKQLFNDRTIEYLSKNMNNDLGYHLSALDRENILDTISDHFTSIIIHYKRNLSNKWPLIKIVNHVTDNLKLMTRYYRLGFAQNNHWTGLAFNQSLDTNPINVMPRNHLLPLKMSPQEVYAYISIINPELEEAQKIKILEQLYAIKNG